MKSNQKGLNSIMLIVAAALILVVAGIILLNQQTPVNNQVATQNNNELNTVSADLDGTDLDSLDNELNQLGIDANTF